MLKIYGQQEFKELESAAKQSLRKRHHLNVHSALDAPVQRLFIATEPETYMRPHRHTESHKWEFFVVLAGRIDLLIFSDEGQVMQRVEMTPTTNHAVEIPPNTWHCYVCMLSGTVALEVKEGAYIPSPSDAFASWAPEEYSDEAVDYLQSLRECRPVIAPLY